MTIPVKMMIPMYPSLASPVRIQIDPANDINSMVHLANCVCQIRGVSWNESTGGSIELCPLPLPIIAIDAVNAIRQAVATMTKDERLAVFGQVTEGYCVACGGDKLPCFCERDD